MNPHRFHVRGRYVLPSGEDVEWSGEYPERIAGRPDWSVATVRHYIVRSAEHYVRKVARRSDLREARVNIGLFVYHDTNNVFSPGLDARHWRMFQIVHSVQNSLARRALALVFPHRMTDQAVVATSSLSPAFRQLELHTGEGMQLCYDARTGSIVQTRSPKAETGLVTLSALIVEAQPDVVYLVATEPVVSLHLTRDCRVSSVLSFRLSHGEQGDIGLRSPHSGKAVCCLPPKPGQSISSHVELDREAILGWEGFRFIKRATPPTVLALIVADIAQRQARGEDIPHYADAGEKFVADAYVATISALDRTAIDAWRAAHGVPDVPWLDNAQPHTL
ncbi:hypothetical protein J2D73_07605 [Acetobacter sacchari]|uniref:DUF4238 domain-containing protein n=1 Tax=Acetobacter sacchari TaxID=2661687 RepID=A0ABS3LUU0_9PROT|nr:hypothetical protein [Acetobacter sacchari]MBO1359658.1 hypothetical protein [Acetobacter sacchari]